MGALKDLARSFSRMTQEEVDLFCLEYGIDKKFNPTAPSCDVSIDKPIPVMSALDFIKSDDTSDVIFEDAPTVPGENVVVEAGVEQDKELVVHGKKVRGKKVTPVQESSSRDVGGLDPEGVYVPACIKWLDTKPASSVVYVNFGSITVMTHQQLVEFCWGLANSKHSFLWIMRAGLVDGESDALPLEFFQETSGRGMLAGWCPQEQVINHPSIGGFLTHSGWNSTVESISSGVPMICWPFFSDQFPNCWLSCTKWGVAMEIDSDVKRDEVERLVVELMAGEKGMVMRKNAMNWKNKAIAASSVPDGSAVIDLEKLINELKKVPK
ncbi:7-deoxyloganetin glucosyltransferase-like [Helianthus annuus]|uniref:7-deoxyloganetin glucosyltransferase-like n=1 Tax=Helianthus annuus TaxID=4232 RepID=UPI0016533F1E|nr:7-deoxyloganetin glucosyltransferase-like [Helianthus annuus]